MDFNSSAAGFEHGNQEVFGFHEHLNEPDRVSLLLAESGVGVKEMVLSGDSLEDYFLKLTGARNLLNVLLTEIMKLKNTKMHWLDLLGAIPANLVYVVCASA